jgi:hypothetical protein
MTECVAVVSPLLAKRPTVLFARLLNATTMSLQSTLLSVRWSAMDVSCDGRSVGAAMAEEAAPSCNLAELCRVSRPW